jgi:hypothetical protein
LAACFAAGIEPRLGTVLVRYGRQHTVVGVAWVTEPPAVELLGGHEPEPVGVPAVFRMTELAKPGVNAVQTPSGSVVAVWAEHEGPP